MSIISRLNTTATFFIIKENSGGWNEDRNQLEEVLTCKCRLVNESGSKYINGKIRGESTHKLFVISDTPLNTSWIVQVKEKLYSIVPPIVNAGGGIQHHLEIVLKEYE